MEVKIILFLLIGFSIAFLLERKPINIIFNFVGILITLAFLINIYLPDAQYFSFILIIIYTSALSILFGFIIMLNPNNYLRLDYTLLQQLFIPFISIFILFFFIITSEVKDIYELFNYFGDSSLYYNKNTNINWQLDISLIHKIGFNLYSTPSIIIKFFIASLILLLSLISLFYLLII